MGYDFQGRRILVTGGAGFIGSHTVDALVERGADVTVVDDITTGRKENLNPRARFAPVSLGSDAFDRLLDEVRPQVIYHFASYVLVPKSVNDPLLDLPTIEGTMRIVRKAPQLRYERIVFASSGFIYGNNPNLPVKETEPRVAVSPYAVAKAAMEDYLRVAHRLHGTPYVIFRYPAVYGPRQVTGAMADYIRKLAAGQQAEFWGDGEKTRDYVYVEDVVRANLMALDLPATHPDPVFNIGTGQETTLNEVYRRIASILGREAKPIYHPDRAGEQVRYSLSNAKAKSELGWEPRVSLEEGLRRTVAAALGK